MPRVFGSVSNDLVVLRNPLIVIIESSSSALPPDVRKAYGFPYRIRESFEAAPLSCAAQPRSFFEIDQTERRSLSAHQAAKPRSMLKDVDFTSYPESATGHCSYL